MMVRMYGLADSQEGTPVQNRTVASSGRMLGEGVAAGDDHRRFGIWINPFYNNTKQKAGKVAAGYKNEACGASFGLDTRANDDLIIGGALTVSNTKLLHKNFKSGDKTKINSLMFSIYGTQHLTDAWYASGATSFGTNDVENIEKRGVPGQNNDLAYEKATGKKYNSMSFSAETIFGYNHVMTQATITPIGGLRYTRVNNTGYKETGTTSQNLDVSTKASDKFEVIVGARVAGGVFDVNRMSVTPELHAFISHNLIGKNPKQQVKLEGVNELSIKSHKPIRTAYNVGVGVNAEFGMMKYGAGYDFQLANKRFGHQGTLRVRVNF